MHPADCVTTLVIVAGTLNWREALPALISTGNEERVSP